MKKRKIILLFFLFYAGNSFSQPGSDISLKEIAGNIAKYKGARISIIMKLRNYDRIFDKLIFYDRNNHDIIFDISAKEKKKALEKYLVNFHEGMEYFVEFTVNGTGGAGEVLGDLDAMRPVIFERIPEK